MNFLKRFWITVVMAAILGGVALPGHAAITNSVDGPPTHDWWQDGWGDTGLLFLREVESIIEDTTLDQGFLTMTNGATIDNETDTQIIFTEDDGSGDEDIIWDFQDNAIVITSATGVVTWNWGAIVPTANQMLFTPVATGSVIGTTEGTVHYDSGDNVLKFRDDSQWVSLPGTSTAGGSDTEIQYNNGGTTLGGISTIIWDDTNMEFQDDQSLAFGTAADWTVNFDDSVDDQLIWLSAATTAGATTDPLFEIIVGTTPTADQQVFGVAKGTQDSNTALFTVDEDGDAEFAGSLTLGSTFYQSAIVAAAAGNVNLTIDAAGNGTITFAATSTGKAVFTREVEFDGAVTLGDATADDITLSGLVVSNWTLDDGITDSPALILQDQTNETATFIKKDNGDTEVTIPADTDFNVVTGNLMVGTGSPGTVAMDGEDLYVDGDSEFNSAVQIDGLITGSAGLTISAGDVTIADQIAVNLDANDEEILITGTATTVTADNLIEAVMAAQTTSTYILALTQTPDADAQNDYIILADSTGTDAKFTIGDGGGTAWTLDITKLVQIDAATSINTSTAGVLDMDVTSATANNKAIYIDYELDNGSSATQYGIYIDLDDDGEGGDETFHALSILNSAGSDAATIGLNVAAEIDTAISITTGAAGQAIVVAAGAAHTETSGVVDLSMVSATDTAAVINIDLEVDDLGAAESVAAIYIDTDDDTASNSAFVRGIHINASDVAGEAGTINQAIYVVGSDCALQADNGYVRIGTGATPDVTPGDDDLFVEGTIEVDGAALLDGIVTLNSDIYVAIGTPVASPGGAELDIATGTYFDITGTNNITSIAAADSIAGRIIVLQFDAILTFTDGNNLKLAGNFVTTADDTITLISDGTNWHEIARSAN